MAQPKTKTPVPALPLDPALVPRLSAFFNAHKRDLPWRRTRDAYAVWVSEIMLQQTRVEAVIPYYERFLQTLPDLASLAACPDDLLYKLWEGLGYYSRARNLREAARVLVAAGENALPRTREGLIRLPGIGRYTAGAVASIAFGEAVPAVDGNVLRVTARLCDSYCNILDDAFRLAAENAWAPLIPRDGTAGTFNQSLFELGATVCLPRTPHCETCPVKDLCRAFAAGHAEELPVRLARTQKTVSDKTVWLVTNGRGDRVVLRRRPGKGVLAGLFEFPNTEGTVAATDAAEAFKKTFSGVTPLSVSALPPARHIFTHLVWILQGFHVTVSDAALDTFPRVPTGDALFVCSREALDDAYSLPSAFRTYRNYFTHQK